MCSESSEWGWKYPLTDVLDYSVLLKEMGLKPTLASRILSCIATLHTLSSSYNSCLHSTRVVAVWQGGSQQTTMTKAGGSKVEEEGAGTEKSWPASFGC